VKKRVGTEKNFLGTLFRARRMRTNTMIPAAGRLRPNTIGRSHGFSGKYVMVSETAADSVTPFRVLKYNILVPASPASVHSSVAAKGSHHRVGGGQSKYHFRIKGNIVQAVDDNRQPGYGRYTSGALVLSFSKTLVDVDRREDHEDAGKYDIIRG
jgi:hypothetical protein